MKNLQRMNWRDHMIAWLAVVLGINSTSSAEIEGVQ